MFEQVNILPAFNLIITSLTMLGLWHRDGSFVYKIYARIISGGLITASLSMIVCLIVRFGEEDVMNSVYYLPGLLCSPIKNICFRKNLNKIGYLIDLTRKKYSPLRSNAHKVIVDESIAYSTLIFKICVFLMTVSSINFITSPLWKETKDLPLIVWVPFDYEAPSVYLKMYIFIAVVFVYNFFTHFGVDLFFYTAMVQVDTQCDILGDTLRNIDDISQEDDREELGQDKKMHKILIESVRHYNVILKISSLIADCYKEIFMIQFIYSVCSLCMILYEMSMADSILTPRFFQIAFFQVNVTVEIFLFCYFCQRVIDKCEKLYYATFEPNWYNASKEFKQDLFIFMNQLKQPIIIYAWNIFPINYETFKAIMQKSWSFFMALKKMNDMSA
ncbi:hypothetical protein MTP99_003657 [Tenebrio molitor]|nr:hypothetical protein MTP99_003657 [Tenebrio molitor]